MSKVALFVLFLAVSSRADTITITATNLTTVTYAVPSNTVARLVCGQVIGGSAYLFLGMSGVTATLDNGTSASPIFTNLPAFTGPALLTLQNTYGGQNTISFCTIQTTPALLQPAAVGPTFTPSTAVVIPADMGGPVTIALESSVDLVNWTAALPGTYGTSTTNRFFRVRASR